MKQSEAHARGSGQPAAGRPLTVLFSYLQLSNVGCEIIVRGAVAFLRQALPGRTLRFVAASYSPDRDRAILADLPEVEIAPMLGWKRLLRGVLRQTGRFDRYWTPRFATRHFADADLFVSIGGDIYAIKGALPEDWLGYESFATARRIPSIMFGANMEGFESLPEPKLRRLRAHLDRFRLLAVRDQGTADYLGRHGVAAPVVVHPDPIFTLRPRAVFRPGRVRTIGLNLSPISVREFGEEIVTRYAAVVSEFVGRGYEFRFIPHVHSSDGDARLEDRPVLHRVREAVDPALRDRVRLSEDPPDFHSVSALIGEVDLLVGARMHACLNALTQGKAVCFLEYSAKAATMVDWLASATPYRAAAAFASTPADGFGPDALAALIAARDALSDANPEGVAVDMGPLLAASDVWAPMRALDL